MARYEPPKLEELTPEQKEIYEVVGRGRPKVQGPFSVFLHNPELAQAANAMTLALREHAKLPKRLFELIVLIVVRHWGAQYAWAVHEGPGLKEGLSSDVIEALRQQRKPDFKQADERAIYEAVVELIETKSLSQANYERLIKDFGLGLTIEIISVTGQYGMVATVLKGFEVPTPNGEKPF